MMRNFLDPEVAHHLAITMTKKGMSPKHHPSAIEQRLNVSQIVFGKQFDNPVGLAAGFDKDGEVVQEMFDLGFGFVEVGTVTPQPQPGNPKPRMYRLVEDYGIINRYGFNSKGCAAVKENLATFRDPSIGKDQAIQQDEASNMLLATFHWLKRTLYPTHHAKGLVGINIGKNKTTDDAVVDYEHNIRELGPLSDFLVVNISSPNTPGLRDLQVSGLEQLLRRCLHTRDELDNKPPLLVKLAPDLNDDELKIIALTCKELDIDGLVVSNTTVTRPDVLISKNQKESGGLSGAPIRDRSTECISKLYQLTDGTIPIIGVGGVGSGKDAFDKLRAGASLVEVYSMMVYNGPGVVSRIRNELAELMIHHGKRSIEDVVGMDHEDIFWRRREMVKIQSRRRNSQNLLDEVMDDEL